jgi:hypothetical protein
MEATLTHQVMDERREYGEPHARARSPGRAGAKGAGARHARVNGPPKSAPPCGGATILMNCQKTIEVYQKVEKLRSYKCVTYISTDKNLADPFTKGLPRNVIEIASREMGMRPE